MSKSRLFRISLAVGFNLALGATVASAIAPAPRHLTPPGKTMLFRVRAPSGGPTIYLLGSVHLLSPDAAKLPASVDSAFAKSRMVAFETSLDTIQLRAAEMLMRARYTNGATLRSSLTPAGAAKADSLLKTFGLSIDQLAPFKPWAASLVMTQLVIQKAGFKPELGVDMQINARAKEANKPVVGLETVDFQLGLFDSIAPEDQEKLLTSGVSADSSVKQLVQIKDVWVQGNATKLDSLLNSQMGQAPGLFSALITNRNRDWIPKIEKFLKGTDDVLVVVGAAHLVGKEGVIELLKAKGYSIEQM